MSAPSSSQLVSAKSVEAKRALLKARLRLATPQLVSSPLSFGQERLWFLDQLEPNTPLYNIGRVVRLEGQLDRHALETALQKLIARHEALRTNFLRPDETPVQVVAPEATFNLRLVELVEGAEASRQQQTDELVREEVNRPFDLATDLLLRATLVRLAPDQHCLVLVFHHIVADEWSLNIFFEELAAGYTACVEGRPVALAELPIQYPDFALWQRESLRGPVLERHLDYWRDQLQGCPAMTELPMDRARGAAPVTRGANLRRVLAPSLTEQLQRLADERDATLFMVLLAAFQTLVHRYTGNHDIIVASPIAGRNRVETERLIGFFVNTLPLRTRLQDDMTFLELLAQVRQTALGALAHQDLPFERLVEELHPARSASRMPFTGLVFLLQNTGSDEIALPGLSLQVHETDSDWSKFDLTFAVRPAKYGLAVACEYARDLFAADTIERLVQHYENLLQAIVRAPQQRLWELPFLSQAERHQVLVEWNQTDTDYPRDRCIHEIFEAQAARHPEVTAVEFSAQALSYGELNARANQLAHFLKQFVPRPDIPIAVCVEPSPEMVVALLAILKAGGAYVPLDSTYPRDRLEFMLADTAAPVLLTQQRLLANVPRHLARVVCLDADWAMLARESQQNLPPTASAESLAYIMYTSGSTGRPKGVAVPHRAVNRLVLNTNFIHLDPTDRLAQVSNFSFDAATFEIWGALLNGARLVGISHEAVLSPSDFAREIREHGITALFLTAAVFNQLAAEAPHALATVRTAMAGGEALDPTSVRTLLRQGRPLRFLNGYGPTENTTFTCCYLVHDLDESATRVPIGRPIANTQVFILDPHLNPVPVGVAGELYAAGDGLARGYWNRPQLTAEKFVPNPFSERPGQRLYRTGDLARFLPDGNIEFLGRIDQQVKLRGYRIELGEIEAVLSQHPAVRECAVGIAGQGSGARRLVAYVVTAAGRTVRPGELRLFLAEKLPDYMVPALFLELARLPLTANGKVDRKALPSPDHAQPERERNYVAPRDALERELAQIWEEVLGVSPVGSADRFFELGGHSLLAVKVTAKIEKRLGKKLRLATIFQTQSLAQLAAVLRGEVHETSVAAGSSLVEIQGHGSRPPLFLVHGAGGGMFWGYVNLSRHLGSDQPVYGFKSRGLDGAAEFSRIEEMAAHYLADLRRVQPQGPYFLGGYCFGGNVAYEIARQLLDQNQQVALLALLNCAPPNSRYTCIPWTATWGVRLLRNLAYWGRYFCQWSPAQRREFFRWKWALAKKRFAGLGAGSSASLAKVEAGELVDLSSYTGEQRRTWEAHIEALLAFHPRPFAGRVHLFRSPGHPLWCSFDPDYGWGELAQGGVTICQVPGAHEKILEEPCVADLARELAQSMDRCSPAQPLRRPAVLGGTAAALPPRTSATTPPSAAAETPPASVLRGPSTDFPAHATYSHFFNMQAGRTASAIAVRFEGEDLTYADLNARSNQLAAHLQSLGVGPEMLVGVCLERSLELPVALLAVLKAGAAYLPLDPNYPHERLAYMLADSGARLLLTQKLLVPGLPVSGVRVVCVDEPTEVAAIGRQPAVNPSETASPDNLAYVIYTSGSTGLPKGVQITHRSLLNHNLAIARAFHLQPVDRVLQFTPISFDISVEEFFPTWLSGCTVVLRTEETIASPARFLQWLEREAVTVLNLPTAYWHELVEFLDQSASALPRSIRLVVIGGEKASDAAFRRWRRRVGDSVVLLNGYGATEATVTTTLYAAQPSDERLLLGKPLDNQEIAILDERLQPVPVGGEGELFIGGAGVARGYLNRPELTAASFVANPHPAVLASQRLYRTGDVARLRPDGNLEFIGRLDEQVKLRGYRIELGEIEAALLAHPQVREAAVIAREDVPGKKRLVAYFVGRPSASPRPHDLHAFLKTKVPGYMVPAVFMPLPALPLTPAGKVDRRALPQPNHTRPDLEHEFLAPRSHIERTLASIWGEVLEIAPIGVEDNFFALGGHSLLAIQILSRIRAEFHLEISLAAFFAHPTVAALAAHLTETCPSLADALPLAKTSPVPLSARQHRLWVLEQFETSRSPYQRALGVRLSGPLSVAVLEQSLAALFVRHDALRAFFPSENSQPAQYLASPGSLRLKTIDLASLAQSERESRACELAVAHASEPYISSHPALRPLLLHFSPTDHWLVLVVHLLVADARSAAILLQELAITCEALASQKSAGLQPLPHSYSEAAITLQHLLNDVRPTHVAYWKQQLQGAPPLLELPADHSRPEQQGSAGARHSFVVPAPVVHSLERLAPGGSLYETSLAAFATLLHRYTGSADVVVGSLVSRRRPEDAHVIGNFENPVALRCDAAGDPAFTEFLGRIQRTVAGARAHAALDFADIVDELKPPRSTSHTPIFQVMFEFDPEPVLELRAGDLRLIPFDLAPRAAAYDLTLHLDRTAEGLKGWLQYSTDLYDDWRIQRLAIHFVQLLEAIGAQPSARLSALPLLPEAESQKLLLELAGIPESPESGKTIIDLFLEQVTRTPDAEALVCGHERLTYAELLARATHLAACLQDMGVTRDTLVGVCLQRSVDLAAALLGTLLAGGAYVPLDPAYPQARLAYILRNSQARVLLTQQSLAAALPASDSQVLFVEQLAAQSPEKPAVLTAAPPSPSDLAYVLYTSGSTGQPKGVAIEHRSIAALVHWARVTFSAEELAGTLASTSVCFDLSVFELFAPLCCGGKVILADNILALPALPAAGEVRLLNTVPSAMRELLRARSVPASVRVANLAGEPLTVELADAIYRDTAVRKVYDLYGPTETTVYSTFALRPPGAPATIGRPLPGEQVYLLDPHLQPVPIGVPGELYLGGAGLARGYLHRPELTAERFIPSPFASGQRLYRTGDRARWRPDGQLELLGRLDHQVKIRGFRIELGEIETALKAQPGVSDAVVVAPEDRPGSRRLVAYVAIDSHAALSEQALRQALRERLPDYMTPAAFVLLERLPLTPNGKVDRQALPAVSTPRHEPVAPRTSLEQEMAAIWQQVLQLESIGIHDNFFEAGGHSLLAFQIISRVREVFNVDLPLPAIFAAPTIAALTEGLVARTWTANQAPMLPLEPTTAEGPQPVSFVQERLWFLDQLEPGSHAYHVPSALRLKGALRPDALQRALNAVVRRHEAFRTTFRYADGQLTQLVAYTATVELAALDLGLVSPPERDERLREWLNSLARQPFDLAHGPLLRAGLARVAAHEHVFIVVMHHAISDGWSLALFFKELASFYTAFADGRVESELAEPALQYRDFVHWQRQSLQGAVLQREVAYWKQKLSGAPAVLDLPTDHPPAQIPSGLAGRATVALPQNLVANLAALGHRAGATQFMTLMAALAITLHKWTEAGDLVLGTVVAGRSRREFESVLGCFMNFLPLRVRVEGGHTGDQVLAAVRETVLEAQSHQDCPFERIVEAVNPTRRLDQNPLYNTALLLQNFPAEPFQCPGLEASTLRVDLEAALLDLRFEAEPGPSGLVLSCEYRTALFERSTVELLLASFVGVLERLVRAPQTLLSEFAIAEALAAQARAARRRAEKQTLALAATFTAEPLAEPLRYWMRRLELPVDIEFAPYHQVFQQLLDPASLLAAKRSGLNVLLLRLEDWHRSGPAPGEQGAASFEENLQRSVREFVPALKAALGRTPTPFLICLCPASDAALADPARREPLSRVENALAAELENIAGVHVLTAAELFRWYPVRDWNDPAGDELGHVPYTPLFFTALATAVARKFHALRRPPSKVIVLDCDQTLWTGVCGEEGPAGLRLEPGRLKLHEFMRAQQEAGMLLCLCSKNNPADVWDVFAQRPDLPLARKHLTAWRLNWLPKPENLRALAHELNLGLESFVFVDDNPVECAAVEASCPEVITLQLPSDPDQIPQFLNHCWVFDRSRTTAEDRRRTEQYRQNQLREQFRAETPTLGDFLAGLALKVEIAPVQLANIERVAQLSQRTNQFNASGRRLTAAEIQPLVAGTSPPAELLAVHVSDRFGDYGLVGLLLLRISQAAVSVDAFLLSCRVLGRGVEHRMLARLGELARARGAEVVDVHFVPSPRNQPAADFLERIGGRFKLPLNGGFIYRFPAPFAAQARFEPTLAELPDTSPPQPRPAQPPGPNAFRKFSGCLQIALEGSSVERIHAQLEANAVSRPGRPPNYVEPRGALERRLCELWQTLLRVDRVGVEDDFFELGGHSLLAVRLFAELEKQTGRKLPLVTLFQAPTVAQLARVLRQEPDEPTSSLLVPIQPNGSKPPLFLVHGAGGDVLWGYANLAAHLPADQPLYGIKSRGQAGLLEPASLPEMARWYLEAVRAFQPQGPYYLGGYCFGGNVAYEMARQLEELGETVALVALMDSAPANAGYEKVLWWRPEFPWRFARNLLDWLQDFGALTFSQQRSFVLRKTRAFGRKAKALFTAGPRHAGVDLEEVIDPTHFPENELKLWQLHLQALVDHVERQFPGQVLLLRTRGQPLFCSFAEDFCWRGIARGGVVVRRIPGSHENIFMEPNVQALAAELALALAEAQLRAEPQLCPHDPA